MKKFCLILIFIASVAPMQLFAEESQTDPCQTLFATARGAGLTTDSKEKIISELTIVLETHKKLLDIKSKHKPEWEDYNRVIELIKLLENPENLAKPGKVKLSEVDKNELSALQSVYHDALSTAINGYKTDRALRKVYLRFLDYHREYFKKLQRINLLLKMDIFPVQDLALLRSDSTLIQDAKNIISKLQTRLAQKLPEVGIPDLESFRKYTTEFSFDGDALLKFLENEIVIGIHRPNRARFWIEHAGFQNQRVTKTSYGWIGDDSDLELQNVSLRDEAEAILIEEDITKYVPRSARLKPNYGEVYPHPKNANVEPPKRASRQYGDDFWIIKKEIIESRATWAPEDSLRSEYAHSPDLQFIPWSFRSLMAPYAITHFRTNSFLPQSPHRDFSMKMRAWHGSYYFEAQVWGPLTIDDVQAFIFTLEVPTKEFYELLKSKNIEVWDQRQWPAKRYYGEESE